MLVASVKDSPNRDSTFGVWVQALMGSQGWIRKAVAGDDGSVASYRTFGYAGKTGVRVIHIEQSESLTKPGGPLQIVH